MLFHADSAYQPTVCNVASVNDTTWLPCRYCTESSFRTCTRDYRNHMTCTKRRRCYSSRYPCAIINVDYTTTDGLSLSSNVHRTAFQQKGTYDKVIILSKTYDICRKNKKQ